MGNMLVSRGIAQICVDQLKCTDDDLMQYTLVLLTNITKSINHRDAINKHNVDQVLLNLLINSYDKKDKRKVMTELASVIGQLANDEDTRKALSGPETSTVTCFLKSFEWAGESPKLKSKLMFALKQLCVNNTKDREKVGEKVIKVIVKSFEAIAEVPHTMDMDFAMNAILLLLLLSLSASNCKELLKHSFEKLMPKLKMTKLWSLESSREKLLQLQVRVEHARKMDHDAE